MSTPAAPARRTFGRVLLAGVSTGCLAAVASSQTWLVASGDAAGTEVSRRVDGSDAAPLALALALVALATWGVILVSGPGARRAASVVGLLAAAGTVVVVVALWSDAGSVASRVLADQGVRTVSGLSREGWYWVAGAAAAAQVLVFAAAFRFAPTWPTMSSRYDAPGSSAGSTPGAAPGDGTGAGTGTLSPVDDLELWKALDEGRDPTDRPGAETP